MNTTMRFTQENQLKITNEAKKIHKSVLEQSFTFEVHGYSPDEVDEFLDTILAALNQLCESISDEISTDILFDIDSITKTHFTHAYKSYKVAEVDAYFGEISHTLQQFNDRVVSSSE